MKTSDFQPGGVYQVGRVIGAVSATYDRCETEPPRRYTQADLMDAMVGAYKFATDEVDRKTLMQIEGLGTARTREAVITAAIDRGFLVENKSKRGRAELRPSALLRTIVKELPATLTSVVTTAKWELVFRMIEAGKAEPNQAAAFMRKVLDHIVAEAKGKGRVALPEPAAPPPRHFGKAPAKASGAPAKAAPGTRAGRFAGRNGAAVA
jgi:DNA topoisomerase-3